MTVLSHQTLKRRLIDLVPSEYDESLVGPASIDLRLGQDLTGLHSSVGYDLSKFTHLRPWPIHPGETYLVPSLEVIHAPLNCAIELKLKSSAARAGFGLANAGWFDPGWRGVATFILRNDSLAPLGLFPGQKLVQAIWHLLDDECAKPYQGKYQGATGAERAK